MTLGLRHGTVALFPHETEWETEADRTTKTLRTVLGNVAADIQHVGSTAITSIMAKPIIDIAVAVRDFGDVIGKKSELEAAGFFYRRNGEDLPEQLLFARGSYYDGTGELQTHFIHVVKADGVQWRDYINFRDYMNANPSAAKEYESLKIRLCAECPEDPGRQHYTAGKQEYVAYALRKALVWSYLGKLIHIEIDRPIGYVHRKENYTLVYPLNYGYIPGVIGGDGEELDVYLLGVDRPVSSADCRVIGAVHRKNDVEDKLIAAPDGIFFTEKEMHEAVRFQEQWYDTEIEVCAPDKSPVS